ncbi:hypothetical protein D3C73_903330 [compost metagenome]
MEGRQIAGQHQADLVGEDLLARVVDHAAAVAVAVKAQGQIGARLLHLGGHLHQHGVIFRVRIVFGEGVVEVRVHLDHLGAHQAQHLGGEGSGRAVAAGGHDLERARQLHLGRHVLDVGLAEALDALQLAAGAGDALTVQDDLLQAAHLVGAEGQGRLGAHLHAGPAVLIVAGRDHGDTGAVQRELGVVGHGRQGQADVQHLHPAFQQAQDQRLLHRQGIAAEVVAHGDLRRLADLVDIGGQAQAQGLDAQEIDLLLQNPAGVVFAKAGRLDQGQGLILRRIGSDVLAGLLHGSS